MLLHKNLLLKLIIKYKWLTLKFFMLLCNKIIVDYWGIEYIEIIIWHFSYYTPYQAETPTYESRVVMRYDTASVIS